MAKFDYSKDELNHEVDFDFFDDKNSEISNSNNNAVIKTSKSDSKNIINSQADSFEKSYHDSEKSFTSNLKHSDDNEDKTSISSSLSTKSSKSSTSSKSSDSSRSSKSLSKYSENFEKIFIDENKSSNSSTKLSNSIHDESPDQNSDSESDVTNVSSLDSANSPRLPAAQKPPREVAKSQNSKYHTHISNMDDVDMIPTEVILQAMMRIHEERRLVQKMKPKWVDPNTKDYSVSGITNKLNLIPERIVSMPKKNIRSNPFYSHNVEIEKRLYHTAINRGKEKNRIDKENKEIELRLRQIRPSPGITKDELLKEYSRLNRFSNPPRTRSRVASTTPTCRPQSSTNSSSGMKIRRTNSSTIISRFVESRQSNSRKSEPKRVMSAISLTSSNSRRSNTLIR